MSFNRENVTWLGRDGKWNLGFFEVCWTDPDGDPEWDVEYSYGSFEHVYSGYDSADAAYQAAREDRGNPGGTSVLETVCDQTDRYDEMAAAWKAANPPVRRTSSVSFGGRWCG